MTASSAPPAGVSAAMVRCARREIPRLARTVKTLNERRDAAHATLADLDAQLAACERRHRVLVELCGESSPPPVALVGGSGRALRAIGGVELRRTAARLLWAQRAGSEIQYREWYERTLAAGYAVNGNAPLAAFLANVRDCPAVLRGSARGYYRLDIETLDCTRTATVAQRAEVARLEHTVTAGYQQHLPDGALAEHRERCDRAARCLHRLERHLRELEEIFSPAAEPQAEGDGEIAPLIAA